MANRRGEQSKTWFRSERIFRVDGDWFIHTREGIAVGPYADRFAAEVDVEVLRSLLVGAGDAEATGIIEDFVRSGGNTMSRADGDPDRTAEVADLLRIDEEETAFDRLRELS